MPNELPVQSYEPSYTDLLRTATDFSNGVTISPVVESTPDADGGFLHYNDDSVGFVGPVFTDETWRAYQAKQMADNDRYMQREMEQRRANRNVR